MFAAAPDMLAVIESLIDHDDEDCINGYPTLSPLLMVKARKAIAKAKGGE